MVVCQSRFRNRWQDKLNAFNGTQGPILSLLPSARMVGTDGHRRIASDTHPEYTLHMDLDLDLSIRLAAFRWITEQTANTDDVLPYKLLQTGFLYEGRRVPLISAQGIFKPAIMSLPLTINTAPKGPYDDKVAEGLLLYKYRGKDPNHADNAGLRELMKMQRPLIYLYGIVPGQYLTIWPVYVVGDDPGSLQFKIAVDDVKAIDTDASLPVAESEIRRAYVTAAVRIRLHQRAFRERVLDAYRSTCAFCRLRHRELLDAAHILADSDPGGMPTINNGIALCKLHHAAFDTFILGITPDYVIQVRSDVLEEEDGPMLQYGLQGLHRSHLILPPAKNDWPNKEYLAVRFARFTSFP